jgi:hypothetical protein
MMRGGSGRMFLACFALLAFAVPGLRAVDMQELIDKAVRADLELQKLGVSRRIAEIKIAQAAAARSWKLTLSPISYGLVPSFNPFAATPELSLDVDYYLTLSAPGPASTSVFLGLDSTLKVPSGKLYPGVGLGASQSLNSLISASRDKRARELGESLSLLQADTAVAARTLAAAQAVISAVKALADLYLGARDVEEQLLDIADEAARTRALDAEGEKGAAFRQLEQKRLGAEESLKRLRREYELRKARLEADLGVTLADELPEVAEAPLELPAEAEVTVNAAVKSAEIDVELAVARIDQHSLSRIPTMSAGLAAWFYPTRSTTGTWTPSLPITLTLKLSWQPWDSGLRALNREELEGTLELKRLALEQARRAFASSLVDLELELMGIRNRTADAERAAQTAGENAADARLLVEKGLKTERDLAKAEYAAEKRRIQLRLLAFDRLAFWYKAQALVLLK